MDEMKQNGKYELEKKEMEAKIEIDKKNMEANIENDRRHFQELTGLGWKVIIIWECEIKKKFGETMARVITEIMAKK